MTPYDLLVKGGRVFDPGQDLDGTFDLGIAQGRITAIQPEIPAAAAKRTIDVRGANRYVVPGLIDLHAHVAYGAATRGVTWHGADPDLVGVSAGVTTVGDGGSTGAYNVGIFPSHIMPRARTRIRCFLNVAGFGLVWPRKRSLPEVTRLEDVDRGAIADCIEANPGLVAGLKVRLVGPIVEERGEDLVNLAEDIAREHRLPLMVHIGARVESRRAPTVTRHLLRTLAERDIVTHLCTHQSGGVMDEHGVPVPELRQARARGVVLDAAHGIYNFSFEVARRQADLGFSPDTISSDVSAASQSTVVYSLLECMAKFMVVGYRFADVIRMTTGNAASALGLGDQLGAIAIGREADLTILDLIPGRWSFTDSRGLTRVGDHALVPVRTIRAGELFAPDWGPHPQGWLPPEG